MARAYGRLALGFEPNRGQSDRRVRFLAHGPGFALFLTGRGAVLSLKGHPLRMEFVGAGVGAVSGERRLPGLVNYFVGSQRSGWHTNIPTFGAVRFSHPWRGIDVRFTGSQRRLEYSFDVGAGADPGRIALQFRGARSVALGSGGGLNLALPGGIVRESAPLAYQLVAGRRRAVDSRYVLLGGGRVGIRLGGYDRRQALVIDPALSYSTYLGGSGVDAGYGIAVDPGGSTYLTGRATSTNFPTHNPLQLANGGGASDAFVAKLSADGSALAYSTYLGGSAGDGGIGIAVDGAGNAYVTGYTLSTTGFPTQNALQPTSGGASDAFVARLSADGSALTYSTYLGGGSADGGGAIAVDSAGSATVTGYTDSINFPTQSALQVANGGGSDAFVAKLSPDGTAFGYSTYLGGTGDDEGYGIALDGAGDPYLTGNTGSIDFPTHNPLQGTPGAASDGFVAKLSADGSALTYSTYLGGNAYDAGNGIAVDGAGNAYVTGEADSTDFPTHNPLQATSGGGADAFVARLSADGSALTYSTYLGGSASDAGYGIAVDSEGNAYVTGGTNSTNFPTHNPLQATSGGGSDAFVAMLSADGSALGYSTYLGGGTTDNGFGIAVDSGGNAYVTGNTLSTNFPTHNPLQATSGGSNDAFVAKLLAPPVNTAVPAISGIAREGQSVSCSQGTWQNSPSAYAYQWNRDGTPIAAAGAASYTLASADVGHSITCTVTATNAAGSTAATSAAVTPAAAPTSSSSPPPPPPPRPTLTAVHQSAKKWREGKALAHISLTRKPPIGTTFRFTLNEAARVRFAFTQTASGRIVKGRCVAPTKANNQRRRCTRTLTRATLSFAGHKGINKVRFQGRVSRTKRLKLGRYTLVIVATNTAHEKSAPHKLTFTIVKR